MALHLTQSEIIKRFDKDAECRISYKGQKKIIEGRLYHVNWKNVVALTILFNKPHCYNINGNACDRDGVRVVVYDDAKKKDEQ